MLVNSFIRPLLFQFSYILFVITLIAPTEVDCIFRPTVGTMADLILLLTRYICKEVRGYDVFAAFGIDSTVAWCATAFRYGFTSGDPASADSCLTKDVS